MENDHIRTILNNIENGTLTASEAYAQLKLAPFDGLAARLVDRGDVALERPPEVDVQHGRVRAQVRARQQGGGIRPAEAEPVVFHGDSVSAS